MDADGSFPKHVCPRCNKDSKEILDALDKVGEKDFRFTIEMPNASWDVFYLKQLAGRPATVAIRMLDNKIQVGAVGEGDWNEDKMRRSLQQGAAS